MHKILQAYRYMSTMKVLANALPTYKEAYREAIIVFLHTVHNDRVALQGHVDLYKYMKEVA